MAASRIFSGDPKLHTSFYNSATMLLAVTLVLRCEDTEATCSAVRRPSSSRRRTSSLR